MATQGQYNTSLQPYRDIDVRISVLDYDMIILDEISGYATQCSISVDADSDIRRTANISMVLKSEYTKIGLVDTIKHLYWRAGNSYWYDKFVQIEVGINNIVNGDYEWVKQGIYLVNSPSIDYDASTNSLTFQAVDLMSKMTGLRNGNLEGLDYTIPVDSSITGVIESILLQQGFTKYILYEPPVNKTPYEIKIDAGGTSYDLLSELRDINSNWEMFFDVEGVFIFQQIPSGKVILDPSTGEEGEPTPVVDDVIWNKLLIDYSLDTSFEDVKNYIEVYGKCIEADIQASNATGEDDSVQCSIDSTWSDFITKYGTFIQVGFGLNITDVVQSPTLRTTPVTAVELQFKDNTYTINTGAKCYYDNEYYVLTLEIDDNKVISNSYINGYVQPVGIAWEENPQSPFYVGEKLSGDNVASGTDQYINPPIFKNMVRYVCSGDEYDNIYTNDLCIQRAKYELYLKSRLHDNISMTTVPIYWLDVNTIISYTLPQEDNPSYWLIKSISTDISVSGTQTIEAIKYYPLYPSN